MPLVEYVEFILLAVAGVWLNGFMTFCCGQRKAGARDINSGPEAGRDAHTDTATEMVGLTQKQSHAGQLNSSEIAVHTTETCVVGHTTET